MYRMTIIILILAAVAGCSPRDKSGGSDSAPGAFSISGTSLTEIKGYTHEDYSGITWLGDNRYAVVTDKKDGFFEFRFDITNDGSVANLERGVFRGDDKRSRDCEGIVFHPGRGTVFISGEQDQEILEYAPDGTKTGSRLDIPPVFQNGTGNYGFEALAYSQATGLFWTTTESTLGIDGAQASPSDPVSNLLRLQSFDGAKLNPAKQYAYKMDKPEGEAEGQIYAMGVPAICALPDGRLLVMEREFFVSPGILDTWVKNKLFITDPGGSRDVTAVADLRTLDDGTFLDKTLVWEHKTELLSATGNELANFEGMCLGPELADGSHTLILVNDAQSGVIPLMKEYFMVLKITY